MEEVFQSWWSSLNSCIYHKFQVISLGAGYDSSYIRLKSNNQLPPCCHYIEVDFPEVMKRKYQLIKDVIDSKGIFSCQDPAIVLHTGEYSLLGTDLTDIPTFQKCLKNVGIDYNIPTLFLSECSITYIDPKCSGNFIVWVQNQFSNSTFVSYEQIYPEDAFGLVMRNHFTHVGCPLKSITEYPNEESQCKRFKELGWTDCYVATMYELYNWLPSKEKQRIQQLEIFDEYEMWHEKCHHYILVWASQGILSRCLPPFLKSKSTLISTKQNTVTKKLLNWKCVISKDVVERFGHQVISMCPHVVLISGGFGIELKKHQRLGDIVLYHTDSKKYLSVSLKDEKHLMGKRMFHSMTKLSNNTIVILGGRSSPKRVFEEVLILRHCYLSAVMENVLLSDKWDHCQSQSQNCLSVPVITTPYPMPVPTWRHSASLVEVEGIEKIVVFGGCSRDHVASDGCFILNTQTWHWSEISTQEHTPCARHSHSAVSYGKNLVIITGGLTQDESILQSLHILDCKSIKWSIMHVTGLLPRYSHTSHIWKDHLFLVGGITSVARYKLCVGVVDLKTLQAFEVLAPDQDPEYPILLSNHSSILCEDEVVILGGGGNCFSFGTHFNEKTVHLNLKQILL